MDRPLPTAVVEGWPSNTTFGDAKTWSESKFSELKISGMVDIFHKGAVFNGVVFIQSGTAAGRDASVTTMTKAALKYNGGGSNIWCYHGRPVDARVVHSFLLSSKRQLVSWEYSTSEVKVDTDKATITVAGKEIATATAKEGTLEVQRLDAAWKEWKELQGSPELAALKRSVAEKLNKARVSQTKSGGKKGGGRGRE